MALLPGAAFVASEAQRSRAAGVPYINTLANLFQGDGLTGGAMFTETREVASTAADATFKSLVIPKTTEFQRLMELWFGTVYATTCANKLCGVEADLQIKLNFVYVGSTTGIGTAPQDTFNAYGQLVSAIMSALALPQNQEVVQDFVIGGIVF